MRLLKTMARVCAASAVLAAYPAFAQNVLIGADFWKDADLAKVEAAVAAGSSASEVDADGYSPLYRALQAGTTIEVVDYLIENGADPDAPGYDNLSPLMLAARFNDVDMVNHFLAMDLDLEYQDDSWRDALGFACLLQTDPAVYQALMEVGMDPTIRDIHGRNCALSAAYLNPSIETIEYIATIDDIKAVDNNDSNAFHQAAFRNPSLDVIKAMMAEVDDPKAVNKDGDDALLLAAIRQKDTAIHQFLIDEGFDVGTTNAAGRTALSVAASANSAKVVQALIDAGADVNLADASGKTPLHHAALTNTVDVVSTLVTAGADVSAVDADGKTALALAEGRQQAGAEEIIAALEAGGAN